MVVFFSREYTNHITKTWTRLLDHPVYLKESELQLKPCKTLRAEISSDFFTYRPDTTLSTYWCHTGVIMVLILDDDL